MSKLNAFKKIIKEAVREAVTEALNEVLGGKSNLSESMTTLSFDSGDVPTRGNMINEEGNQAKAFLYQQMMQKFGGGQATPVINGAGGPFQSSVNPLAAFLNDTANSMTAEDAHNLRNF